MDVLRADDVAQARRATPGERLRQALEMMAMGIAINRANLQREIADSAEVQARLRRWLSREDD